ncbi:MAG TPA: hypothetical protein DDW65_20695 [Firmicutes bacterium]|jgi:Kef-type K+ transport system membrane component KefB|nr:hypothetical protein [Bacillota bacterium]
MGKTAFESLLIICIIAFILPILINKIKKMQIPVVVAEIIFGMLIGNHGLHLVKTDPILEFLSLLGFAYLMFLSGLEIDFSSLKQKNLPPLNTNPFYTGIKIFLCTIALSFLFANILKNIGMTGNALFLTLIFATTSLGIVIPSLRAKGILQKPIGQTILMAALIADFGTMFLIPVVMFFTTGEKSVDLIYGGIILIGAILIYFLSKKHLFRNTANPMLETSQMMVRASFALMLTFVALAEMANIEIILGAFIAGILYAFLFKDYRHEIQPKLEAIGYGFLIPIFFITLGVSFDFKVLLATKILPLFFLLLYITYIVKILPALLLRKYFGWRETLGTGILLSSRLSLIIAISFIAFKEGIINQSIHSTLILIAMVTCLVSPLIFIQIFPNY